MDLDFCVQQVALILLGQKTSTFLLVKLDALILASDLEEYFIQYLGRVMRREDVEPYIFDIVDILNV